MIDQYSPIWTNWTLACLQLLVWYFDRNYIYISVLMWPCMGCALLYVTWITPAVCKFGLPSRTNYQIGILFQKLRWNSVDMTIIKIAPTSFQQNIQECAQWCCMQQWLHKGNYMFCYKQTQVERRFANNTEEHVQVVNLKLKHNKTKRLSWCRITKLCVLSNHKIVTHDLTVVRGRTKTQLKCTVR